jgi:hypothetical protein
MDEDPYYDEIYEDRLLFKRVWVCDCFMSVNYSEDYMIDVIDHKNKMVKERAQKIMSTKI